FPKLFKSKNEQLYAFSANGLLQYNKNELQFIPLTIDTIITFNNSYNSIASIADGPDNSIFLATANGLVQVYPDSIIRTNLFKSSGIDVMIHSDEYGNLWAIMRDFSLHWYNPLTKETKSYQNSSIGKVGDVNGNAIITANGLLFCSAYNGVQRLKYNNKGDITFLPIQLFTDTVNRVLSFYTEKNGQINAWAAARTHLQGEYLTVSQSDDFLLPNKKVSQFYESLADPYLFEDNNNQLWIGSLKGLIKIPSIKRFSTEYKNVRLRSPSRQNNYLQFIKDNKSIIESPEDQIINDYELFSSPNTKINIWSYYFDSDTTAILSYVRNGLKYIKRKGNTANEINIMELAETDAEKELLKSLANDFVIALKIVGDDYLISVPRNLIVWNRKTHSIIKFDKHNSKISNFVQYIETDGNISLLLSHNGVLNYYDHKLHQVISPKINSIEFPHFKNESTFSQLKFDTDGYIWLAGKELVKCDYSDSILQVKEYYSSDQLKIDGRIQFLAMNNEQLWYASTESAGCLNLSVKTLYSIPYINRYFSSLISDLTILNNGQILFVSDPDLIVMDTKKMMETEAPRIRINGIYVSNSVNSD
ncbi:MAG: hypothetical protein KDD94_14680, partial [Calditrichaeota bacterium]|nr:hypothetical protein [Calditrichota bacterium]